MKNETEYSGELVKALKSVMPNSVIFKHTDMYTSGIPDISATWLRCTSWIEVKVAVGGKIKSQKKRLQLETCKSLERVGICLYVVYTELNTHVIKPSNVLPNGTWLDSFDALGENHVWASEVIRARHVAMERQ